MKIRKFPLGRMNANSYIIHNDNDAVIIDIGDSPYVLIDYLRKQSLSPVAIILTHLHFDHTEGLAYFLDTYKDVRVFAHSDCYLILNDYRLKSFVNIGLDNITDLLIDGDVLQFLGTDFRIIHTPGHSPESICILVSNHLFSGDTLFNRSIGRTDFPLSNHSDMKKSLSRLLELQGDIRIYPGHGENTKLSIEKKHNPFLK